MSNFTRAQRQFDITGLNLAVPYDRTPAGQLPYFQNIRSHVRGMAQARPGMAIIGASLTASPINSILRLSDETDGAPAPYIRIVGAGTELFAGVVPAGPIDSGYSGNPVSMVTFRPDPAVSSFAYVADSQRQSKIDVLGARTNWGSPGPLRPPTAVLGKPLYNYVANFDASDGFDIGSWVPVNTGGAIVQQTASVVEQVS